MTPCHQRVTFGTHATYGVAFIQLVALFRRLLTSPPSQSLWSLITFYSRHKCVLFVLYGAPIPDSPTPDMAFWILPTIEYYPVTHEFQSKLTGMRERNRGGIRCSYLARNNTSLSFTVAVPGSASLQLLREPVRAPIEGDAVGSEFITPTADNADTHDPPISSRQPWSTTSRNSPQAHISRLSTFSQTMFFSTSSAAWPGRQFLRCGMSSPSPTLALIGEQSPYPVPIFGGAMFLWALATMAAPMSC